MIISVSNWAKTPNKQNSRPNPDAPRSCDSTQLMVIVQFNYPRLPLNSSRRGTTAAGRRICNCATHAFRCSQQF